MNELTWVEISREALEHNIREFRGIVGPDVLLCPCIKANAYGHGLVLCAKTFLAAGADWLAVNSLYEARTLRQAGIKAPIYILGHVAMDDLPEAVELECRTVAYNPEMIVKLGEIGRPCKIHIKIETGNNRQGVLLKDLVEFAEFIQGFKNIQIEGLTTHFANIEDTTDHSYAELQLERFREAGARLEKIGMNVPLKHCANSAAALLFPETHFQMVRIGIAGYGMWPSMEVKNKFTCKKAAETTDYPTEPGGLNSINLIPALAWKSRIAQIKSVPAGEPIGYGCTYRTVRETRLAIIPIGYYDGYDRGIQNGHVLIRGKRAFLRGRICMNIIMVDVTDIPEAGLEDEVVLIGKSCGAGGTLEELTAEQFADWAGTINYEVTTRINERIPRVLV